VSPLIDLHIRGGLIAPMRDPGETFRGDLLIHDGRLLEVTRRPATDVTARESIDASGCLVLPGFIQGHVHVVQSLLRHQADELRLLDWLRLRTWPYEAALDGDATEDAAELGIVELLRGGTTCAVDFGTTRHHDRVFDAARRLGIRFLSGRTHMDSGDGAPQALIEDSDRSLADAESLGQRWHGAAGGRLRYAVAPRFALSCSRRLLEGCRDLARRHGWLLQTHASENRDEVAAVRAAHGMGNVAYLASLDLVGPDVIVAHAVWLDEDEFGILSDSRTRVCHCPGANLKLASGIADVPRLRSLGVPVLLGADGAPCNNRLSAVAEMTLAATIHGLRHGPSAVTAWDALSMVTRDAAEALHLGSQLGTLEPGKLADLVVVDLSGWSLQPDGDPAARLVYGATACAVRDVVVDGRVVVRRGVVSTSRADELRARIIRSWQAVRSRMEEVR
jgi:cytosine/adenosine deaminase-related metal-dependent hydrolase